MKLLNEHELLIFVSVFPEFNKSLDAVFCLRFYCSVISVRFP